MKLTKKQRMTAYSIMLAEIDSSRIINIAGFCALIDNLFEIAVYNKYYFKIIFPELWKKRPAIYNNSWYWFREYDWKSRRKLLIEILTEYYGA